MWYTDRLICANHLPWDPHHQYNYQTSFIIKKISNGKKSCPKEKLVLELNILSVSRDTNLRMTSSYLN